MSNIVPQTSSGNVPVQFTTQTFAGYAVKTEDERPIKTPDGLLTTRAVETITGWMGQIIVCGNIVWQSEAGLETEKLALSEVNLHMVECLARLFV